MNYHIIIAVILFTVFSLFLTSCDKGDCYCANNRTEGYQIDYTRTTDSQGYTVYECRGYEICN